MRFSHATKPPQPAARLAALADNPLDVLVIGGGIVGAGVARDAAMRGLKTGLVEARDFAFGTSSRSSRLLHGGLRYLAQGRLGLVREASVEKLTLHRIAPHLALPLPFIFPTRRHNGWPRWKLRIGVKLYDLLCGRSNLGASSSLNADQVIARLPGISSDRLTGAVEYFDAFTNDARLVIDTLRSAEINGAILCNYAPLRESTFDGQLWRSRIETADGKMIEASSRAIVNAAGAWADQFPSSRTKLRVTKGVHCVIDHSRLPVPEAVVMADGKRILFAIPWGNRVILGTTDTDFIGDLNHPTVEPDDIPYILHVANSTFPAAKLVSDDIRSTWVGVRPLIASANGGPSDISRRHVIQMPHPAWFDVAGGKLTTYRLMAEQTVDQVVSHLKINAKACATATTPLLPDTDRTFSQILPPEFSRIAVEHFCRNEWAATLPDIMIRRTSWQHYVDDPDAIAKQTSQWMAELLGWDEAKRVEELANYLARHL